MSLYSPREHDEHARTGQRPGQDDWPLADALGDRSVRTRLGYLAAVMAIFGLIQLILTASAYSSVFADRAVLVVNGAAAVLSLALAALLWQLRRTHRPVPGIASVAVAVAAARAVLAIAVGIVSGRPELTAVLLPGIACAVAVYLIVRRARELRTATA